jgi:alpha,alpha-trehalase
LFQAVQRGRVFADQKTFVDCVPKVPPAEILARYTDATRSGDPIDLKAFVAEHFIVPGTPHVAAPAADTLGHHLERAWTHLRREPDKVIEGSSLLPLENPYIVPGGRFREIYYWDTFFTMLGLRASNHEELIVAMADNLASLIRRYRVIPNGNRSYYLTRSQPPVFALIVELIARRRGPSAYLRYRAALETEWDYWNDRHAPTRHRCELEGGEMYRYYDQSDEPRWEAFAIDEEIAAKGGQPTELFRHLRSATESGWDFSSRWYAGGSTIAHTRTTEFAPVDLNCFIVQLERTLAAACAAADEPGRAAELMASAERRAGIIRRRCWSETAGFFFDFHLPAGHCSAHRTLAAVTPLFLRIATPAQADAVAKVLRADFLQCGGFVTTLTESGEQWDFPNGWAPLQWMAIKGLTAYGHHELAAEVADRWMRLNAEVFKATGCLMEKYNVVHCATGGGGEYPPQDGFGWTNGVLLDLMKKYPATTTPK